MEENDVVRSLITTIGSFIEDRLTNKEQRIQHKDHCAERLAAEDRTAKNQTEEIHYSDQAVLANLDWGIEALEEAIATSNVETKMARLEYAEKMLQVCAMLHSDRKTAGVPNFYLSAWAHLNLSYLWKLKNDNRNSILHMLEMFVVDPFFSRVDFAPELWRSIFSPHMSSIIGWYSEERRKIVFDMIPDNSDLSLTVDFDHCFNESLILSVRPEQAERIQALENLYAESLDSNTRLYAKYYKDCMNYDAANTRKAILPMMPIVEPPMTPLHEISSRLIPDYVKFGPVLPKSAGFSTNQSRDASSRFLYSKNKPLKVESAAENLEDSACWDASEECMETMSVLSKEYSPKSRRESSRNSSPKTPSLNGLRRRNKSTFFSVQLSHLFYIYNFKYLHTTQSGMNTQSGTAENRGEKHCSCTKRQTNIPEEVCLLATFFRAHFSLVREMTNLPLLFFRGSSMNQSDDGRLSYVSSPTSEVLTPQSRPPKDFVCPITGQIFNDPVTLETGQTYERKAIQEWTNRGNTSCPITRQPLSAAALPKTNYVLKRLITSWKDQHPDIAQEFSNTEIPSEKSALPSRQRFVRAALATSPTSVISQASVETVINALKPYILCLCNSEDLKECEEAVLTVSKIWEDSNVGPGINSYLSSPTIVNGFMEILSASFDKDVLRTTICTLSKLICADDRVRDLLTSIDSDFYCLTDLLKKGLVEAAVLVYLLRPSFSQISRHDLVGTLVRIISDENEDVTNFRFSIAPKDAAIALLEQIVIGGDESEKSVNAMNVVVTDNGIPALLSCLDRVDGRQSVVSILLRCMRSDSTCKNVVANGIELSHVLELFHNGDDSVRGMCVEFLCELVRLKRYITF
ncbi:PREDICTED: putative E3 ubiquitin-protein ligase LIN-1 [Erythranthe guttata]|uniref:putative E3 ubiquitin-protein ligase LIN-1 n=1 Tax=Erythranthe guttata TaxID=4155 RepID=UPI00064DB70C|nr:PREDICTED: putative E3 ubiquitin-protein ligase LIN-1 [Erythranthe guttata]|eukprot:XP_012835675.1 PREDICTED: putative E3 ubiquitin-protein ligase LIN-1 [Erythranthe guttata]